MKVLLCIPTHNYNYNDPYEVSFLSASDFPVGVAYIAGALKQAGHEVIGLNPNNITGYTSAYDMIYDQIKKNLELKPDLIGLGGLCTDFTFIRDAMEIIRKLDNNVPIVLGGGIVNNDAEYIFNLLKPDFAVVGEGEEAIVNLCGNLTHPEKVANLWYWEE